MQRTIELGQYAPNRCPTSRAGANAPGPTPVIAARISESVGAAEQDWGQKSVGQAKQEGRVSSIPYKSLVRFSVEPAGHFDLEAELKVWTSGMSTPIQKTFSMAVDIYEVQGLLAEYVGR